MPSRNRVAPKEVPNRQVIRQSRAIREAHIEMMRRRSGRAAKRLTTRDPQVAEVLVTQRGQSFPDPNDVRSGNDHVDIYHRFRRQPGNGRAADVLDRHGDIFNSMPNRRAQPLEDPRPVQTVVKDDGCLSADPRTRA